MHTNITPYNLIVGTIGSFGYPDIEAARQGYIEYVLKSIKTNHKAYKDVYLLKNGITLSEYINKPAINNTYYVETWIDGKQSLGSDYTRIVHNCKSTTKLKNAINNLTNYLEMLKSIHPHITDYVLKVIPF